MSLAENVAQCYQNLSRIFEVTFRALQPEGKLVVIESTVPDWFLTMYKLIFPVLLKVWPLSHPATFQYHYRDIDRTAEAVGFQSWRNDLDSENRKHHDAWVGVARLADANSCWESLSTESRAA